MLEGQELGVGDVFEMIPSFRTEFPRIWPPKVGVHVNYQCVKMDQSCFGDFDALEDIIGNCLPHRKGDYRQSRRSNLNNKARRSRGGGAPGGSTRRTSRQTLFR
jgi:hypothetical protein